jgi:hypothetical protein
MNILVPLDGSERTLEAIKQAAVTFPSGKFTYLVVSDVMPKDREELFEGLDDEIHVGDDANDVLEAARAIKGGSLLSKSGNHSKAIIAASGDFDILVMHGMDKSVEEMARMSSLTKISRRANCALFLANC